MRCVEEFDQYIPPLWVMCLESVAHLLVLFNFPINIPIIIIIVIVIIITIIIITGHAELLNQLPHLLLSLSALQKGAHQGGVASATSDVHSRNFDQLYPDTWIFNSVAMF